MSATPSETSWNERIIREFRANNGKVGGMFDGVPLVLLTTAGRKTGRPHTTPVVHLRDEGRHLVFASNAGRPNHPDWYQNVLANPQVTMEIDTEKGHVRPLATRAVALDGDERDHWYERQCALDPAFRQYQEKAARKIPVVALYPLDLSTDAARNRMIGEQLIRHHDELRAALRDVRGRIDDLLAGGPGLADPGRPADLAAQLRRHCLTFCHDLQMHHTRENGAFSAFEDEFPDLAPAIERLRAEHQVMEKALTDFETLVEEGPSGRDVERFRAQLDRVVAGLEDHFAYEEANLLPAVGVTPPPR
ncbi:nitroreductase/quinone reductase family protein [Actinoallomurus purpureus]|uniref:nitroreductase/quinone reductase family protein n=1 Tax=Actinoallomurus purpureus TaxID=478114 RepID=UPI002092CCCE|nr:nitroreductase/quinone reductase family protein [Actinoallomurus purpureus]MCO6007240.1 nitroreductase/quinone reductase family protein [Actinoallomurus purpureus]